MRQRVPPSRPSNRARCAFPSLPYMILSSTAIRYTAGVCLTFHFITLERPLITFERATSQPCQHIRLIIPARPSHSRHPTVIPAKAGIHLLFAIRLRPVGTGFEPALARNAASQPGATSISLCVVCAQKACCVTAHSLTSRFASGFSRLPMKTLQNEFPIRYLAFIVGSQKPALS